MSIIALLLLTGCFKSRESDEAARKREADANTAAGKVGQAAHTVAKEAGKAAKVVGKELGKAAREAEAGWKKASESDREKEKK